MPDFELVISDNSSEDGTEAICREAARDPRVRYLRQPTNTGAAANYNLVFRESHGDYFRWASHDDVSAPNHLERCLEAYSSAPPHTVLVYPLTVLIDEAGEPLATHRDDLEMLDPSPRRRLQKLARNWGMCNPVMGLMRRDAAERTRLIDTFAGSDLVFLAELALQGLVVNVPDPLFLRRIHPGSAMQGSGATQPEVWLDPNARARRGRRRRSTLPLLAEIVRSVERSDLPALERAWIAAGVSTAWVLRRAQVHGGAAKQVLLRRDPAPVG